LGILNLNRIGASIPFANKKSKEKVFQRKNLVLPEATLAPSQASSQLKSALLTQLITSFQDLLFD